ncbi:hypothetical protein [Actinomadura sp. 9N407]|uniref:hypothetical protein n=1 Tax=Actinomadura sp. 9N407 TaxID=3375154 RepID=UPI00379A75FC
MEWNGFPPLWADIAVAVGLLAVDAVFLLGPVIAFLLNLGWFPSKIRVREFLRFNCGFASASGAAAVVTGGGMLALGFWITGIVQIALFGGLALWGAVSIPFKLWDWRKSERPRSS